MAIDIFEKLQKEIDYLFRKCKTHDDSDLWSSRMKISLNKYVTQKRKVNQVAVENFRKNQIFLSEEPTHPSSLLKAWWYGRSQIRYMQERLDVVIDEGDLSFLQKYQINYIGKPNYVEIDGLRFNKRWLNNIRNLSLASQYLRDQLSTGEARILDIGGGYGIFSYLLKNEFGHLKSAIVEFPEQLILTYYFLASSFPNANINTLKEVYDVKAIDQEFIDQYDFVLIPVDCYSKIERGTFNIVSNFYSLGEMSEEWFHNYVNGQAFQGAEYFFTINRFQSWPSYRTNLNIVDYKLKEYEELHFQINKYERYYYKRKYLIFYEKEYYTSPIFEFIGKRK